MKDRYRRWNIFILYASSAHFALVYTLNTRPFLDLSAFEAGRERSPFQYRALTAWILAAADRYIHIPSALHRHLPSSMSEPSTFTIFAIAFVSLIVAVYATVHSLRYLTGDDTLSRWGALLVICMAYFHYVLEFGHPCCTPLQVPYDLPSVAFFAVAIYLIIADRMVLLYLCFAASCLNRESSLFLIAIFILYRSASAEDRFPGSKSVGWIGIHACALLFLWLCIRTLLHHLYPLAAIPEGLVYGFEIHVWDNVGYLLRPYYWTSYLSMFCFSWIYIYAHWRQVPHAGIRSALWIGPIVLLAMYVVGVLSEVRIFGELISLFTIALVLLLRSQFRIERSGDSKLLGISSHSA
jgi:hypothetical protein